MCTVTACLRSNYLLLTDCDAIIVIVSNNPIDSETKLSFCFQTLESKVILIALYRT